MSTAASSLSRLIGVVKDSSIQTVRRVTPQVLFCQPGLGGGNHMYIFLHAWRVQQTGRASTLLRRPEMDPWLEMFPKLRDLSIDEDSAPWNARRAYRWYVNYRQFHDVLSGFIDDVLLSSERFAGRLRRARDAAEEGRLVLNVRRGDYYSNPEFHARFSVDHEHLFRLVRDQVLRDRELPGITVVSDDPEWCVDTLPRHLPGVDIQAAPREDMFDDLAHLATAPLLVMSNSTFSYWGGYLNEHLHGDPEHRLWAPTFHERPVPPASAHTDFMGGRFQVLSNHWNQLDNAPHEATRPL